MKNINTVLKNFLSKNLIPFLIIGFTLFLFDNVFSQENKLKLNDMEYFETQGLNVFVFSNQYNGFL